MNTQDSVATLYLLPEIWNPLLATSCCDNIPDYGNLRREGFILAHNSRSQHIVVGKSRWQEVEAAGHIASVLKSREHAEWGSARSVLFILSRVLSIKWCYLPSRSLFPSQSTQQRKQLRGAAIGWPRQLATATPFPVDSTVRLVDIQS